MERMKRFKPHYVFLNHAMADLEQQFSKGNICKVFFVEIMERGKFRDRK